MDENPPPIITRESGQEQPPLIIILHAHNHFTTSRPLTHGFLILLNLHDLTSLSKNVRWATTSTTVVSLFVPDAWGRAAGVSLVLSVPSHHCLYHAHNVNVRACPSSWNCMRCFDHNCNITRKSKCITVFCNAWQFNNFKRPSSFWYTMSFKFAHLQLRPCFLHSGGTIDGGEHTIIVVRRWCNHYQIMCDLLILLKGCRLHISSRLQCICRRYMRRANKKKLIAIGMSVPFVTMKDVVPRQFVWHPIVHSVTEALLFNCVKMGNVR